MCQNLFFNKAAGPGRATLSKKRLWYRSFAVKFAEFLRTLIFKEHLRWLILCPVLLKQLYSFPFNQFQFVIFNPWTILRNWITFYWNSVEKPSLVRGDSRGLTNETYLLKSIVSSKQYLRGLKTATWVWWSGV